MKRRADITVDLPNVVLEIVRLFYKLIKGEGGECPSVELGEFGERFDPGET